MAEKEVAETGFRFSFLYKFWRMVSISDDHRLENTSEKGLVLLKNMKRLNGLPFL